MILLQKDLATSTFGSAYQGLGYLTEVKEYYEKSLEIAETVGDKARKAEIYSNLGAVCYQCGEFEKAAEYNEKNLKISQEIGSRSQEGHAYGRLGIIYRSLGNFEKAFSNSLIIHAFTSQSGFANLVRCVWFETPMKHWTEAFPR